MSASQIWAVCWARSKASRLLFADVRSIALAGMFVTAAAAAGYLVGRWRAKRYRTVIWVAGVLFQRGWAGWSTPDRIAAVAVLVGLLGVVVTVLS